MLLVAALVLIREHISVHLRQPQRFVEFPIGEQSSVTGNLAAYKSPLQPAVKTEPQIVESGVTHCGPLFARHKFAANP